MSRVLHFIHKWSPWGDIAQAEQGGLYQMRYCVKCRLAQLKKVLP